MRTIRRWVRNLLLRLPERIGDRNLLPKIRSIYDKLPLYSWRMKRYARSEARRCLSHISSDTQEYTLVFDIKVSGLGYGTLVNFVALARFLNSQNVYTNLYFLETEVVTHDGTTDTIEINNFIDESIDYSRALLKQDMSTVKRISPKELEESIDNLSKGYLMFDDFVRNRRPFFRDCFNVCNFLMASLESHDQNSILYSPAEFERYMPESFRETRYVSWACRYSEKGGDIGRQTNKDEFHTIYLYLNRRFPDSSIMVVSDAIGCDHYSELANELGIDTLMFSKEYSPHFLGDAALVMNSEFFFSFRAGGMSQVPLYSKLPFEVMGPLMNEIPWDKQRVTSWQTAYQTFVILKKHQFEEHRELDLTMLGFQELSDRSGIGRRQN